jgi:anhydro-N-acetylmuramic acid kinase
LASKTPDFSLVLGIMSGTSLDGLDLALCRFADQDLKYQFEIIKAATIPYLKEWKEKLAGASVLSAEKYFALHAEYGSFIGDQVNLFLSTEEKPKAIASHGHTVFHQPDKGFSTQIGCGATIAAKTGITTVNDFRSLDVALAGQGAPLVPIGDEMLFSEFSACLNIGGIANISFSKDGKREAYDVCVANMLLNFLSEKLGFAYDAGGELAKKGTIDDKILNELDSMPFYSQKGARSIGREWFEKNILPRFKDLNPHDGLATATEHIARKISEDIKKNNLNDVLVTGGGAYNELLIERIRHHSGAKIIIPADDILNFKEALIFAFLGFLRLHEKVNTLSSVTASKKNSVGGAVYLMK